MEQALDLGLQGTTRTTADLSSGIQSVSQSDGREDSSSGIRSVSRSHGREESSSGIQSVSRSDGLRAYRRMRASFPLASGTLEGILGSETANGESDETGADGKRVQSKP